MDKPRVKPLEWRVDENQNEYAQVQYSVDRYCIEHRLHADDAFDLWIGPDATTATRFPTLESAKAAAQADYEARILAAIKPASVSVQEAARVLLEYLGRLEESPVWEAAQKAQDCTMSESADVVLAAIRAIAEGKSHE